MLQNRHRNHHCMMFPQLAHFTDVALLLLRVVVGVVFITSGWNHLKDPEARSKDIGMSKGLAMFLGAAEVARSLGVIFGVLTQLAASGLILLMLGAIQKKIFVWRTGFWGRIRNKRMELRHDVCRNESRDRHYRRWKRVSVEMSDNARATLTTRPKIQRNECQMFRACCRNRNSVKKNSTQTAGELVKECSHHDGRAKERAAAL